MKIGIDITPISGDLNGHKVRGVGKYIELLQQNLPKFDKKNSYIFFRRGENVDRFDLIHYPYFEPFFLTLPLFQNKRTIVTVHDLTPLVFPDHFPAGLKGSLKWQLERFALQKVDRVIADSQSSKKDIHKLAGISDSKINVVYLAADDEYKKIKISKIEEEEFLEKYHLPEKFVLYVGDATWNKNLPRLIDAIKKINLTLIMVGRTLAAKGFDHSNPWNKDLVYIQKETKNDKRFIKLGFIPTEDVVMLYNLAMVTVLPSLYEGFGLPVLEAMNCGCPVVTTQEGSIPEVVGDAAFIVDSHNSDIIANGIGEVYFNKPVQEKLKKKGLEQAEKFSLEKMIKDTVKVYESVVNIY